MNGKWTTEVPKKDGWYWVRHLDGLTASGFYTQIVYLNSYHSREASPGFYWWSEEIQQPVWSEEVTLI